MNMVQYGTPFPLFVGSKGKHLQAAGSSKQQQLLSRNPGGDSVFKTNIYINKATAISAELLV